MARTTASMARNGIRRALVGVLDRYPSKGEIGRLWEFFDGHCVYCDAPLSRQLRNGHTDHLIAVAAGGSNHLSNFVLSCGSCNGDERRESDWLDFLKSKSAGDDQQLNRRRLKILAWAASIGESPPAPDSHRTMLVQAQIAAATDAFDKAHGALLAIRDGDP